MDHHPLVVVRRSNGSQFGALTRAASPGRILSGFGDPGEEGDADPAGLQPRD